MFIDIDVSQQKKYNQNAYGDYFVSKRFPETGRLLAVLSDGLGSGIKANILACMTATMLLKFMEEGTSIKKSCETIMNSLPVCQVRKISYSTFSALDCDEFGNAKIVEEGNPQFLWVRNGKILEPDFEVLTSKEFPNRHMHIYHLKLQTNDRLIFCSDGVTQSALGSKNLRLGLRREGLIEIVKNELSKEPDISSSNLAKRIVKQAILNEPDRLPKDDVSAVCVYYREPRNSVVFTGPPYHQEKDSFYAKALMDFKGKKAIAGGTTANLISRELNIPIRTSVNLNMGKLPAISYMDGIDLVTEGILTLTKTCEYLDTDEFQNDAAGELANFMKDTDCITFMVGAKLNQAHYDPNLPIEIEIRKNIIKKLSDILQNKYFKKVNVQYM
ncbi:SpoIIE family protein phosphatase [bacterium]|nr:SpoIIE family protein phosphatase [bacterium]